MIKVRRNANGLVEISFTFIVFLKQDEEMVLCVQNTFAAL